MPANPFLNLNRHRRRHQLLAAGRQSTGDPVARPPVVEAPAVPGEAAAAPKPLAAFAAKKR